MSPAFCPNFGVGQLGFKAVLLASRLYDAKRKLSAEVFREAVYRFSRKAEFFKADMDREKEEIHRLETKLAEAEAKLTEAEKSPKSGQKSRRHGVFREYVIIFPPPSDSGGGEGDVRAGDNTQELSPR